MVVTYDFWVLFSTERFRSLWSSLSESISAVKTWAKAANTKAALFAFAVTVHVDP